MKEYFLADLHLHSPYARATSPRMDPKNLLRWAELKGLDLIGTGDFTHPLWRKKLAEVKDSRLLPTTEVSLVFEVDRQLRKVHVCLIVPDLHTAEGISQELSRFGDLSADGRPTLSLDPPGLVDLVREYDAVIFMAHIWTPWYSLFGSKFGCDSLQECLDGKKVDAMETGLSSDPDMNWLVSSLDPYPLVSFSDAHSPENLGREATAFPGEPSYEAVKIALANDRVLFTVEFFPEEGKYHFDGHRKCGVRVSPEEYQRLGGICPKCGRPLTKGVLHRVYELKDREKPRRKHPFYRLVPLREVLAQYLKTPKTSQKVKQAYLSLVRKRPELHLLLHPDEEILGTRLAQGLKRVLEGKVMVEPGYDGVYGSVRVLFDRDLTEF